MYKFLHFNVTALEKSSTRMRKRFQSRTVAAEPLSHDKVMNIATAFLTQNTDVDHIAYVNVGVTLLSLKDRYNRQTGREEATKKMKLQKLKVKAVEVTSTHVFVRLETFQGVGLSLRTNKQTKFTTVCGTMMSEGDNPLEIY